MGLRQVAKALAPPRFDRLYGALPEQVVKEDANGAASRSAARYLREIGS